MTTVRYTFWSRTIIKQPLRCALMVAIFVTTASSSADSIDDFAAQLVCQMNPDCVWTDRTEDESSELVIDGYKMPDDAMRDRDNDQSVLVRQGAYLREDGVIVSLSGEPVAIELPERGRLSIQDYGTASEVPVEGPVLIRTPATKE